LRGSKRGVLNVASCCKISSCIFHRLLVPGKKLLTTFGWYLYRQIVPASAPSQAPPPPRRLPPCDKSCDSIQPRCQRTSDHNHSHCSVNSQCITMILYRHSLVLREFGISTAARVSMF
jgi:hypothetical protein